MKSVIVTFLLLSTFSAGAFAKSEAKNSRKPTNVSERCIDSAQFLAMQIHQNGYGYGATPDVTIEQNGEFKVTFMMGGARYGKSYKMTFVHDAKSDACMLQKLTVAD